MSRLIKNLIARDEFDKPEVCRCRVDYLHGQTTFHSHQLTVLEEAARPRIMMGSVEVSTESLGWLEVKENTSLGLRCVSEGGVPPPNITWWLDDTRLEQGCTL